MLDHNYRIYHYQYRLSSLECFITNCFLSNMNPYYQNSYIYPNYFPPYFHHNPLISQTSVQPFSQNNLEQPTQSVQGA